MSLLREIQTEIVQERTPLGSIFLKLRVIASRLGSEPLEEWIRHESEGYPPDSDVPFYRVVGVIYRGTFFGPFDSRINNAQIPLSLIEEHAGKRWTTHEIRQGIVEIDNLIERSAAGKGKLGFDASDLMLRLQGKIYEGHSCNGIEAQISRESLVQIQHVVRTRILDLTLELEKSVPSATNISFASSSLSDPLDSAKATQVYHQTINGNPTFINSGDGSQISVSIGAHDESALIRYLVKAGITKSDASALAEIMASEEPTSKEEPFGDKAKAWMAANLRKAVDGTWKVAMSVAGRVLTEAALKYYGLK